MVIRKRISWMVVGILLVLSPVVPNDLSGYLNSSFGASAQSANKTVELTLEALKAYNGTKGKPMYVAYKGIVYDVSKVEAFKKNSYKTLVPGTDITKALEKIKNGEALLKAAIKVGKIVAKPAVATTTTAAKVVVTKPEVKPTQGKASVQDDEKANTDAISEATKQLELTLEELKAYDGKGDHLAYVAVDGIIYDVTAIPEWKDGIHQGKYKAGQDLTEAIKRSPHGKSALEKAIVVGKLKKD